MGSTSSIAKPKRERRLLVSDGDTTMRRSANKNHGGKDPSKIGQGSTFDVPPTSSPPPTSLPPLTHGQCTDDVDAPVSNFRAMKGNNSGVKDAEVDTIVAIKNKQDTDDSDVQLKPLSDEELTAVNRMKKECPKLSKEFDNIVKFVSILKKDPGLKTHESSSQTALGRDLETLFLAADANGRKYLGDLLAVLGGATAVYDSYHALMTQLEWDHINDDLFANMMDKPEVLFLSILRALLWNYTDSSLLLCEMIGLTGMFKYLIGDLTHMTASIANLSKVSDMNYTFDSCVGILHNTSKNPVNRPRLRVLEATKHLLPFLKCQNTNVKTITLLTLSYILDEDQNNLLLADDSVFDLILHLIVEAWKTPDHRYNAFSAIELIEGLTRLVKNDDNKKLLVKKGTLPMLLRVLEGNEDEQEAVFKCVWELSFDKDNRAYFSQNKGLMDLLRTLKNSDNKKVSKAASGALWEIHLEEVDQAIADNDGPAQGQHIMISYQWADQKKLLQVKESLRARRYKVWMDVDNMGGSTLQAMAEAVQNSAVVLVCISERYKESQNCRSEAEYAFCLQKPIVPLLMQRNYKSDGWLGILKGTKLFFDFSGKYDYDLKMVDLIRELGSRGQGPSRGLSMDESQIPVIRAGPVEGASGSEPALVSWSSKDVHNWLSKSKITLNNNLQELTGQNLVFLRKLSHRAPEFYYSYIERKLQLTSVDDLMHFSNALDSLQ